MTRHEAGPLKQHNKPFKSRHATKGQLKAASKGRVAPTSVTSTGTSAAATRAERRNAARQRAQAAREALVQAHRASAYGARAAPRLLAVVGLGAAVDVAGAAALLAGALTPLAGQAARRAGVPLHTSTAQRHALDVVAAATVADALDLCKVADAVLLVVRLDAQSGRSERAPLLSAEAEAVLAVLKAQGVPAPFVAMQGAAALVPATPARVAAVRAALHAALQHHLPDAARPLALDTPADAATITRLVMAPLALRPPAWRANIPHMLAERVSCGPATTSSTSAGAADGASEPCIGVTGFLRAMPLSADRLVHITGLGTFQVDRIEEHRSPYRLRSTTAAKDGSSSGAGDDAQLVVAVPSAHQEALASENVPDPTDQEQTWPTEDDMADAVRRRTRVVMVPEGTSAYQARWLADDDDDEEEEEGNGDDDSDVELGIPPELSRQLRQQHQQKQQQQRQMEEEDSMGEEEEEEEDDGMKMGADAEADDIDYDEEDEEEEDEEAAIEREKARRRQLEEEDAEFPDEMEAPTTVAARVRFQKYRGLRSFRTSPWGPQAELPADYARLFSLANYRAMARKAVRDAAHGDVAAGCYVTVWLRVPRAAGAEYDASPRVRAEVDAVRAWAAAVAAGTFALDHPLLLSGLRRHENRTSVVHFHVRRPAAEVALNTAAACGAPGAGPLAQETPDGACETVKSRDLVLVEAGFRRYAARPAFSEATPGVRVASRKQKFLRFLPRTTGSGACCASVYGPVADSSVPVLLWSAAPGPRRTLLCTGSFECADTERLLCKKVVLTALPYKINRRTVVARGMFHNREDVEWFKPLQLVTKLGHTGEIVEPIGTHGVMKCIFDSHLRQNDTICLNLYKRVFPKFP